MTTNSTPHEIIPVDADNARLPAKPSALNMDDLAVACRRVYEDRHEIIMAASLDGAQEDLRRAMAIERYLTSKEGKDSARRAARVLETAVGMALGPTEIGRNQFSEGLLTSNPSITKFDRHRFRLMSAHRDLWWPKLDEKALSRRQVLTMIAEANRPVADGPGEAFIDEAEASEWLADIGPADLLLTDPPYSTDVDDIGAFVQSWLPAALGALAPHGRAFIFIGAYAEELGAYCSHALPDGWQWGVPHAWCYRNTIGPTPEFDFIRNWQCMITARGPKARPLRSDRITELLSGYVENAPDGRHETKLHRWQKPITVMERLIKLATDPGGIVIDPFAGSGTTMIAARDTGRRGFGCDSDPEAVRVCLKRGCDAG